MTVELFSVKPVDGCLGRGRIIKGDGGLTLQLAGLAVSVQVDHGLPSPLVHLDHADLLEEVGHSIHSDILTESLDEDGVVVGVVLV